MAHAKNVFLKACYELPFDDDDLGLRANIRGRARAEPGLSQLQAGIVKPHGKRNHIAILDILGMLIYFPFGQLQLPLLLLLFKSNHRVFGDGTLSLKPSLVR